MKVEKVKGGKSIIRWNERWGLHASLSTGAQHRDEETGVCAERGERRVEDEAARRYLPWSLAGSWGWLA